MVRRQINANEFFSYGFAIFSHRSGWTGERSAPIGDRPPTDTEYATFVAYFGTTPQVCMYLWAYMMRYDYIPAHGCPPYLLWALMFVKLYSTETVLAHMVGVTEKTYRKWVWLFLRAITKLESKVVSIIAIILLYNH